MDNWKAGDLALCVAKGLNDVFEIEGSQPQAPGPIVGLVYTVAKVSRGVDCYGHPGVALLLAEIKQQHPRACGYNAHFFQKAEPLTEPERAGFLIDLRLPAHDLVEG